MRYRFWSKNCWQGETVLKSAGKQVPLLAYDCFLGLEELGVILSSDLTAWNAAVGLRNRIVHNYMNIDMARVLELVKNEQYRFITNFILAPITTDSVRPVTKMTQTLHKNYAKAVIRIDP